MKPIDIRTRFWSKVHIPRSAEALEWARRESEGINYCPHGYDECQQGCCYPGRCGRFAAAKEQPMTPSELKSCPFCGHPANGLCLTANYVRCSNESTPHCPASFGCVSLETWNRRAEADAALKAGEGATYTEGICADGAAILKDGVPMRVEEVLAALNAAPPAPTVPEEDEP